MRSSSNSNKHRRRSHGKRAPQRSLSWRRLPLGIRAAGTLAVVSAAVLVAFFKASAAEEKTDPPLPALRALSPAVSNPATHVPDSPVSDAVKETASDSTSELRIASPPADARPATTPSDQALLGKLPSDNSSWDATQSEIAPSGAAQGTSLGHAASDTTPPEKSPRTDVPAPDVQPAPRRFVMPGVMPKPAATSATLNNNPDPTLRIPLVNEPAPSRATEPAADGGSPLDSEAGSAKKSNSSAGADVGAEASANHAPEADPNAATASVSDSDPAEGVGATAETAPPVLPKPIKFGAELPKLPAMEVAPVFFRGVQPGATTRGELVRQWGDATPGRRSDGSSEWLYAVPPYPKVTVTLTGQIVATITAKLKEPVESHVLIDRLKLKEIQSLPIVDDAGVLLGSAFPEQGLILSFAPGTKNVAQMLLETIDPEPFLARAAQQQRWHPQRSLRDLEFALRLDPKCARAHDLQAQILSQAGRLADALQAAEQATHFDPQNSTYTLDRAEILGRLGHRSEALQLTKEVVAQSDLPPALKAHALCQLGDLTLAASHDDKQALKFHLEAIKAAEPLIGDTHQDVRRTAKRALVDAHLGAANDIAWGVWQQKSRIVPKWLAQAKELARDLIEHEDADPELSLKVAREALFAAAGSRGAWDSTDWVQLAQETATTLLEATDDPLRHQWLEWELGMALSNLLEFENHRGLNQRTLGDALRALKHLEQGASYRQPTAEDGYLVGRLYFQVGVIYAVKKVDHATAVAWFEQALPWFNRLPSSVVAKPGRQGDMFVSMGISFWETGRREEALRLTQRGADLIGSAVKAHQLEGQALAIPYGNLAAMHRTLGHIDQAREYTELASAHDTKRR